MAYEQYIAGYRQHRTRLRQAQEQQRLELTQRLRAMADQFDALPSLRRVYLFGSAATAGRFSAVSDVDLAFEGLPADCFCGVLSELVERLERSVDGVRIEDASPSLRQRIIKGEIVYERRTSPTS